MNKITDHFRVGDKVKWVKLVDNNGQYLLNAYSGFIVRIVGSTAIVETKSGNVGISLFELEVINE